jgi:ankyrin repeat protein
MLSINMEDQTIVYAFTGRKTGEAIEYSEIGKYDTTYEDNHFLNSINKIRVYLNAEDAMAPLAKVSLNETSVTDEMFKHGVPLHDIPGYSSVTIGSYSGLTQENKNVLLLDTAATNNIILAKQLLAAGADVHADDDDVLIYAVLEGNIEIVKILLMAGADVHARNDQALQMATRNGHVEIVKLLLDYGADVHAGGDKAVISAVKKDRDITKVLLDHGADLHAQGDTALRDAAYQNDRDTVAFLLAHYSTQNRYTYELIDRDILGRRHTQKDPEIVQMLKDYINRQ